ncbi:MAG: hypothetical protein J7J16_03740 [Deltaproteobacteria bacterium]|nr:hypothetical protein [Deltaproteobacteria bacterium]
MAEPFYFHTQFNLVEILNKKSKNVIELLEGIKVVPDSSIFYHTHKFLEQHHYLLPEPANDFAYWISDVLEEKTLGEEIGSVDIVDFPSIRELRNRFIEILEEHIDKNRPVRNCTEGSEFHFMACKTFILPTPYIAHNLKEFKEILRKISKSSLYFHIFEARIRLGKVDNDFSRWLRDLGKDRIAAEISHLDPYTYTLEGLREKIISIICKEN